jgi:transcriptional regulator with XRE-family HTH domain|nr:helix-turn-helix domain-containing protein [uncultured Oscillibacter sp.]
MGADSKENRIEIAKRIKKARKDAGLTQAEVAKKLGLTPQAISNYERGINNIPAALLFDLAQMYGLKEFSFLDNLPEPFQFGKSLIDPFQYSYLEYEWELNNKLSDSLEFERRGIVQDEIKKINPNNIELFLAEQLRYGTHPNEENTSISKNDLETVYTILDALLRATRIGEPLPYSYGNTYMRIQKLIALLQAYEKIKCGYKFIHEEHFDPPRTNMNLSQYIKKHDPENPPQEDYITIEKAKDGKPIVVFHDTDTNHPENIG